MKTFIDQLNIQKARVVKCARYTYFSANEVDFFKRRIIPRAGKFELNYVNKQNSSCECER